MNQLAPNHEPLTLEQFARDIVHIPACMGCTVQLALEAMPLQMAANQLSETHRILFFVSELKRMVLANADTVMALRGEIESRGYDLGDNDALIGLRILEGIVQLDKV